MAIHKDMNNNKKSKIVFIPTAGKSKEQMIKDVIRIAQERGFLKEKPVKDAK